MSPGGAARFYPVPSDSRIELAAWSPAGRRAVFLGDRNRQFYTWQVGMERLARFGAAAGEEALSDSTSASAFAISEDGRWFIHSSWDLQSGSLPDSTHVRWYDFDDDSGEGPSGAGHVPDRFFVLDVEGGAGGLRYAGVGYDDLDTAEIMFWREGAAAVERIEWEETWGEVESVWIGEEGRTVTAVACTLWDGGGTGVTAHVFQRGAAGWTLHERLGLGTGERMCLGAYTPVVGERTFTTARFLPSIGPIGGDAPHRVVVEEWLGADALVERICEYVGGNLTLEEWRDHVSETLPYEKTCPDEASDLGPLERFSAWLRSLFT